MDAIKSLRKMPLFGIIILLATVLTMVFAPYISRYSPYTTNLRERLQPPSFPTHLFGTDELGRDILTRTMYGSRTSLIVALAATLAAAIVGSLLGTISGFVGGKVDSIIARLTDMGLSFPVILFGLLLAVVLGPGLTSVIIAASLVVWARFARIVRGEALSLRKRDFILQARICGCSSLRIVMTHIFPNLMNTIIVLFSLNLGTVIIIEAALSFLGAGIPPPTPSWGQMVSVGRNYLDTAWWVSTFPGLAITLVVLALNTVGDWLRDALDPKLRQI